MSFPKYVTKGVIVPDDVSKRLSECCYVSADFLLLRIVDDFHRHKIISPIEQMLYVDLRCLSVIHSMYDGIRIVPQHQVGKYRADFMIAHGENKLIVECDGHVWHETTEQARREEKERDRFLSKHGYVVFHYTGKEIKENPLKIAGEIFDHVLNHKSN